MSVWTGGDDAYGKAAVDVGWQESEIGNTDKCDEAGNAAGMWVKPVRVRKAEIMASTPRGTDMATSRTDSPRNGYE